eukprot:860324-Amphidinium_carterae.1
MGALQAMFQKSGLNMKWRQAFSCESDEAKRRWIEVVTLCPFSELFDQAGFKPGRVASCEQGGLKPGRVA